MLYTFGCSFTSYGWPTWADLLLNQVDGENWGMCGGGNKFIFESLMECIIKKNITSEDHVAIMWSTFTREDRYINGRWQGYGNVYNAEPLYDKEFLQKYWDDKGAVLNNLNIMCATVHILNNIGCNWKMMTMNQIATKELANCDLLSAADVEIFNDHISYFNKKSKLIDMPLYTYNINDPNFSLKFEKVKDHHPTPLIHGEWLCLTRPFDFIDYSKVMEDASGAELFISGKQFPQWKYPNELYYSPSVKNKMVQRRI